MLHFHFLQSTDDNLRAGQIHKIFAARAGRFRINGKIITAIRCYGAPSARLFFSHHSIFPSTVSFLPPFNAIRRESGADK